MVKKNSVSDVKKSTGGKKTAVNGRRKNLAAQQARGFMDFVREQGVVGLAVGLAIGTQAGATVKTVVDGFINPVVGFLVGSQQGLAAASWNVVGRDTEQVNYWITLGQRTLVVKWGAIVASFITLLAVAAVIYFVVKGLKLDKLDKKKES